MGSILTRTPLAGVIYVELFRLLQPRLLAMPGSNGIGAKVRLTDPDTWAGRQVHQRHPRRGGTIWN